MRLACRVPEISVLACRAVPLLFVPSHAGMEICTQCSVIANTRAAVSHMLPGLQMLQMHLQQQVGSPLMASQVSGGSLAALQQQMGAPGWGAQAPQQAQALAAQHQALLQAQLQQQAGTWGSLHGQGAALGSSHTGQQSAPAGVNGMAWQSGSPTVGTSSAAGQRLPGGGGQAATVAESGQARGSSGLDGASLNAALNGFSGMLEAGAFLGPLSTNSLRRSGFSQPGNDPLDLSTWLHICLMLQWLDHWCCCRPSRSVSDPADCC